MLSQRAARRYATAIFSLAQERDKVAQIGADLEAVYSILESDPQFKRFFTAPVIDRDEKSKVLIDAFENRIDEASLHTVLLLVRKRRETLLGAILTEYRNLALVARGLEPLVITSARPLGQDELDRMVSRLSEFYGKQFDVRQEVDSNLIGGVRMLMGDRRIDGSVSGRLEELAATLFSRS
jgi:F-type H+-transporting ATPase subunit delta